MDLHLLQRQGHSVREIARLSGYARNTVRAVLRTEGLRQPKPRQRSSPLDPYQDYLRRRHAETGLSAVRLLEEIRAQEGPLWEYNSMAIPPTKSVENIRTPNIEP